MASSSKRSRAGAPRSETGQPAADRSTRKQPPLGRGPAAAGGQRRLSGGFGPVGPQAAGWPVSPRRRWVVLAALFVGAVGLVLLLVGAWKGDSRSHTPLPAAKYAPPPLFMETAGPDNAARPEVRAAPPAPPFRKPSPESLALRAAIARLVPIKTPPEALIIPKTVPGDISTLVLRIAEATQAEQRDEARRSVFERQDKATGPLLALVRKEAEEPPRLRAALRLLQEMKDLRAVDPLISLAGEDPARRTSYETTVARIGGPQANGYFLKRLAEAANSAARVQLLHHLAHCAGYHELVHVVPLCFAEDAGVKQAAGECFRETAARLGGMEREPPGALPAGQPPSGREHAHLEHDRKHLVAVVYAQRYRDAERVAELLSRLGPNLARRQLEALLRHETPAVRARAVGGFSGVAGAAGEVYRFFSRDESPLVRAAAAHTLAGWPEKNTAVLLLEGLKDADQKVRQASRDALAQITRMSFPAQHSVWRRWLDQWEGLAAP